jgi:hypothetical protein
MVFGVSSKQPSAEDFRFQPRMKMAAKKSGLPDFLCKTYQNEGKYVKWGEI